MLPLSRYSTIPAPVSYTHLPVLFSYRFYNQDLTTGSLLIEIGGHGNNLNEALYAGPVSYTHLDAATHCCSARRP